MLNLLGASPVAGVVIGVVLLVGGLLGGWPVLAIAGGVALVASAIRLMDRTREDDGRR
jgi:hypothetical protein